MRRQIIIYRRVDCQGLVFYINCEFFDSTILIHAWYVTGELSIVYELIAKFIFVVQAHNTIVGTYQVLSQYNNYVLHKSLLK